MLRPNALREPRGVEGQRVSLRNLEGGPQAVVRAGCGGVRGPDDHVSTEGIFTEQKVECVVGAIRRNLPRAECAVGQVGGQEGLTNASDDPRLQHRTQPLGHLGQRNPGLAADLAQWVCSEAVDSVLAHRQDTGIDGIRCFDRTISDGTHVRGDSGSAMNRFKVDFASWAPTG